MTDLRRPRLMLTVLAALLLSTLAVPIADARLPRATPYRAGGPITLDTNLLSVSGVSAWAIDDYLKATTSLPPLGAAFLAAEQKYGINARFLLAAALHESGWGTGYIARVKHNLFGYNAYDRDPLRYATAYATYAANIDATAHFLKDWYLTPGGRWWGGQPTLRSMQQFWSSSHGWGVSVSRIASSIHLGSIAGRSIVFGAPVVSTLLHPGEPASVDLKWTGGAIPAGVVFVATWQPIELDSEAIAAATSASPTAGAADTTNASQGPTPGPSAGPSPDSSPDPSAAPSPADTPTPIGPTRVPARVVRMGHGSMRLALATPVEAGSYLLDIELRDTGDRPLPAAEQVDVPTVEVSVWGDRAVSYDLAPGAHGTGLVARITNTGRTPIPAVAAPVPAIPGEPPGQRPRSVVTVTASGSDPSDQSVLLVASPLTADLAPGASLTFELPDIAAGTGRATNWLSVKLTVLADPTWLAAYPPLGAWFSEPQPAGAVQGLAAAGSSGSPASVAPSASAPAPAVASPPPSLAPSPAATPTPAAAASPVPVSPPAAAVARPSTPVTTSYSEHSAAIAYRGAWGDAPYAGYIGGNVAWSRTPGSTATFTFTGASVSWIGPVGPTRGLALVLVDGQAVARISLWRSTFVARSVLFRRSFGSVGRHTLTIEVLSMPSHPYVAIDGFAVVS